MKDQDIELYYQSIRYLKKIEKIAADYNIKTLVETHFGNIISSAGLAYNLLKNFNPKYIGVIYDPGNMIVEGKETWKIGMEILWEYLAHVHVKNLCWRYGDKDWQGKKCNLGWHWYWAQIDHGMVPWLEVIRSLKLVNYKGYLSLEDFSSSSLEKRLKAIECLKRLMDKS